LQFKIIAKLSNSAVANQNLQSFSPLYCAFYPVFTTLEVDKFTSWTTWESGFYS